MVRMSAALKAERARERAEEALQKKLRNELYDVSAVLLRGDNKDVLACLVPCLAKFELPANLGNPLVQKPDHGAGSDEALDLLLHYLGTYPAVTDILSQEITRNENTRLNMGDGLTLVMYCGVVETARLLGIPPHILAYVRLAQIRTSILDYERVRPWREEVLRELSWLRTLTRMVKSMTPGGAEFTNYEWLKPGCVTPAMVLAANYPDWALRNNIEPRIALSKVRLPPDLHKMLSEALAVAALVQQKNNVYSIAIGN